MKGKILWIKGKILSTKETETFDQRIDPFDQRIDPLDERKDLIDERKGASPEEDDRTAMGGGLPAPPPRRLPAPRQFARTTPKLAPGTMPDAGGLEARPS